MSVTAPTQLDLRCPFGPRQLLAKVSRDGDYHGMSPDGLTLDIACRDCAKQTRKTDPRVRRVVHRFNVLGQLVDSEVQLFAD
jgi:hypothetical protein